MGLPDDQNAGPDEPPLGRIFVPEGPIWEAMVAPDGRAVGLSVQVMKRTAQWLRRARPQPFGFAPDKPHPAPVRIGNVDGSATITSGLAAMLGRGAAVWTMSILYGDTADRSAPAAKIISCFHRVEQDRDMEEALREAATEWRGGSAAPDVAARTGWADGVRHKVTQGDIEVLVSGSRLLVPALQLAEFSAFQVRHEGVLVTVIARHIGPEFPEISRLADLEPMIYELEHPDREAIAAAFAEKRLRQIEEMRSQTGYKT